MLRRTWILVALVTVAAVVAAVAVVFALTPRVDMRISASSTASGTSPDALRPGSSTDTGWQSDGQTVGAWVDLEWSRDIEADRVRLAPVDAGQAISSATLVFGDGASLLLTPDDEGRLDVSFPSRHIDSARLTVAAAADGATSVSLGEFVVDDSGDAAADDSAPQAAASSSSAADTDASALTDGNVADGSLGREWAPASDDTDEPWVELSWPRARELASVQIFGPSQDATDPAYSAAAPLNGRLVFDDGSTVVVSGIDGGEGKPTTIAFMPRMASSVRLELQKTIPQAVVGLREFVAYDAGATPPVWASSGDDYESDPPAAQSCDDAKPRSVSLTRITLLCPSPNTTVGGTVDIVVQSPDAGTLEVSGWQPSGANSGSMVVLGSASTGADGIARFRVDTSRLAAGPIALKVESAGELPGDSRYPLYVQLVNGVGTAVSAKTTAPAGMTLQWEDDFTAPLSVSYSGKDATYAATKPQYWGGSEFGDAVFDKPDSGRDTFSTVGGDYLRIRALPLGDYRDTSGWDRKHTGGLMSSLDIGASGFSAQYGYYEARMLGPGGPGTWPAFWMLNTQSATKDDKTFGEADAVELYGHDTLGSCHALHQWTEGKDDSDVECLQPNGYSDWAMTWHTYGVHITPNGADFYVDGDLVMSKTGLFRTEEPFYFLVNLELGGGWPVDLSGTEEEADLYVDWIRVYT